MLWADASEIVVGLILGKKLALNSVRSELFMSPYSDIIKILKTEQVGVEELIGRIGLSPVQAAIDAAKSVNGLGSSDWVKILEQSAVYYDAGNKLEKFGRRLQQGDTEHIDWASVASIANKAMNGTGGDFVPLSDVEPGKLPFKLTGFKAIDEHLGGLPEVGQVIVAAPPGTGKSTFMVGLASCYARTHPTENVAIFTLEMTRSELALRFSEISKLPPDIQSRIQINDGILSPEEVLNKASMLEHLGLVCVDFADLLIKGETTESTMAHIYRTFMLGSKILGCPIVLLSQLNRGYSGGIPRPQDIRYCLPASAKIPDAINGGYFSPREVSSGAIWAYTGKKLCPSEFFCEKTGTTQNILKITTRSGFILRCSDNHPLLSENGWKEAKEIVIGEAVAVVKEINPHHTTQYSPQKARLLGYMLGDGCMPNRSSGGGINWVEPDELVVADFKQCLKDVFPNMTTRDVWHRNAWKVNLIAKGGRSCKPTDFALWLEELKIRGIKSKSRYVPAICFSWDTESIRGLLQGLFTSDGSVANGIVSFASYAPQLLLDVKHLLLRFGIKSRISSTKLSIADKLEARKFRDKVGFIGKKQKRLADFLDIVIYDESSSRGELLPIQVTKMLTEHGFMSLIRNRRITKYRLDRMMQIKDDIEFYSNDSIWWDEIKSIEQDGVEETYDLSVPLYHNFVVDGFVTHNTGLAEALSWMILMLYNPSKDWFDEDAENNDLAVVEGTAYIVCWKIRGGFRKHLDDSPGAIQIQFKGDRGFRLDSPGKWFSLNKH